MVGEADRPGRRQRPAQQLLALDERQRAQVVLLEAQQVEGVEADRVLDRGPLDVRPPPQAGALLQALEVGPRLGVEDHHLAVEDQAVVGQGAQGAGDLRI